MLYRSKALQARPFFKGPVAIAIKEMLSTEFAIMLNQIKRNNSTCIDYPTLVLAELVTKTVHQIHQKGG